MWFKKILGLIRPQLFVTVVMAAGSALGADLHIGIIGCDTSHCTALTETLNDPSTRGHVSGGKVVAAYKGGSRDIPESWSRVEGYANTLRERYHDLSKETHGAPVKVSDIIQKLK